MAPCAEHGRIVDRLGRLEDDLERLCVRLEQQNAAILATLGEMRKETAERFESWSSRDHRHAAETAAKLGDLRRDLDRVSATADLRRSILASATAIALTVAAAVIVFLLKGCVCSG